MVLWCSQVVSTVGARVTSIAFPLLVLAVTHSPAKAGVVGFAQTLPYLLLYLPAGALIDRWDRKRTMPRAMPVARSPWVASRSPSRWAG
jgi:MFS family permease